MGIEAKNFRGGGMDTDSAISDVAPNDVIAKWNLRNTGTQSEQKGDETSIEGTNPIFSQRPAGINKCIGAFAFEVIRKSYAIISNSFGNWQLTEFDYDSLTETVLFTNKTDSGGISLFDLDPQNYINDMKLVQKHLLIFTDSFGEPHYVDINILKSKALGAFTKEDFSLIKGQPLREPTYFYNDDSGRTVNLLKNRLFQFRSQYEKLNFERTAWSTISKRNVPIDEPTPTVGTDVTKSNNLVISVDAGSTRDKKIIVGGRYDLLDWFEIKSVERSRIVKLTETVVNVSQEIYEAYNPTTNMYSFAFYNDGNYPNIDVLETDLLYDYIPNRVNTLEVLNGSILALGGVLEGYPRNVVDVNISVSSYDPDITVVVPDNGLKITSARDERTPQSHRRYVEVNFAGQPKTGDKIFVQVRDLRDTSQTNLYSYTVPSTQQNNLSAVINSLAAVIPNSAVGGSQLVFQTNNYYELDFARLSLTGAGTGASKSIHSLKTNSSYQLALAEYDSYGRPFPIITDERFVVKTQSYALTHGLIPQINWDLKASKPSVNARTYQWLLTINNTHQTSLYINGAYDDGKSDADYMVFNIKPLVKFNETNSSSILNYDYSEGDRVTLNFTFSGSSTPVKWFDNPAIDVEVVGLETVVNTAVTPNVTDLYLKVRKSSSLSIPDITNVGVLMEIYSPKKRTSTSGGVTTENPNLFFEIGERYDVVNGEYSVKTGVIKDGDAYFKTRYLTGALDSNVTYGFEVESFDFSDFYKSDYTSYGRPRSYDDEQGTSYKEATIRYSDTYILGSKINGLTRFFGERIYGEGDGQSSSSHGAIWKMRMRDNYLVLLQELKVGHVPVSRSILEDLAEQRQVAISDRLLNTINYLSGNYGIGTAKESYGESQNGTIYFADPNNSLPMRDGYDGLKKISGKKEKYFRTVLKQARKEGLKLIGYYDKFNDEYNLSIETKSGVLMQINFNSTDWQALDKYNLTASTDFSILSSSNGITVDNNNGTATFTPTNDFVGNGGFTFSFVDGGSTITKNACIAVTAGNKTPLPFNFIDLTEQPTSTLVESNSVLIYNITIPSPISIVGGEYQVNGGAWTSAPSTVINSDSVKVRLTTSGTKNTTSTATLTVGGYSDSFDVTTTSVVVLRTQHNLGSNPHSTEQTIVEVNGVEVYRGTGSYYSETAADHGDIVKFTFLSTPLSLPWSPDCGLSAVVKTDGDTVYNQNLTVQAATLGSYQLTIGANDYDISLEVNPLVTVSDWKIRELNVINTENLTLINFKVRQNPDYRLIANLDIINGNYFVYYNTQDAPTTLTTITNDNPSSVRMWIRRSSDNVTLYDTVFTSGQTVTDIDIPVTNSIIFQVISA